MMKRIAYVFVVIAMILSLASCARGPDYSVLYDEVMKLDVSVDNLVLAYTGELPQLAEVPEAESTDDVDTGHPSEHDVIDDESAVLEEVLTAADDRDTRHLAQEAQDTQEVRRDTTERTVSTTEAPKATPKPQTTAKPDVTSPPSPEATPNPEAESEVKATAKPTATSRPTTTSTPTTTSKPTITTQPSATTKPTVTSAPVPTATTKPASTPAPTATPKPTVTASPSVTSTPKPTSAPPATPSHTVAPVATPTPVPTPTPHTHTWVTSTHEESVIDHYEDGEPIYEYKDVIVGSYMVCNVCGAKFTDGYAFDDHQIATDHNGGHSADRYETQQVLVGYTQVPIYKTLTIVDYEYCSECGVRKS